MDGTPIRNPLREVKSLNNTPENYFDTTPRKNLSRTPKMSPGPALLLAIKLSCSVKRELKPLPLKLHEDKENDDVGTSKPDVRHFRNLLISETSRITSICEKWDELLVEVEKKANDEQSNCYGALLGDIRSTIGQGRLIMKERFHQFTGLVDNCEFHTSEKPVTCQDLQGFWDMIYFQVEDVDSKFSKLDKCREANWDLEILEEPKETSTKNTLNVTKKKKVSKKVNAKMSEAAKARKEEFARKRSEARKRLAAAKAALKAPDNPEQPVISTEREKVTFDAGFFKIDSPLKSPLSKMPTLDGELKKQVTIQSHLDEVNRSRQTASNQPFPDFHGEASNSLVTEPIQKKLEFGGDCKNDVNEISSDQCSKICTSTNKPCEVSTDKIAENLAKFNSDLETYKTEPGVELGEDTMKTSGDDDFKASSPEISSESEDLVHNTSCEEDLNNGTNEKSVPNNNSENLIPNNDATSSVEDSIFEIDNFSTDNPTDLDATSAHVMNLSIFIDEATRNIEQVSGILQPHRSDVTETDCHEKNKDNSSPEYDAGVNSRSTRAGASDLSEAVSSQAMLPLQTTLEKILQQHQVLEKRITALQQSTACNDVSSDKKLIEQLNDNLDALKSENTSLKQQLDEEKEKRRLTCNDSRTLSQILFDTIDTECDQDYQGHYYRVLAQVKVLQAELDALQHLKPEWERAGAKMIRAFSILNQRMKDLEEKSKVIEEKEKKLEEERNLYDKELQQNFQEEEMKRLFCEKSTQSDMQLIENDLKMAKDEIMSLSQTNHRLLQERNDFELKLSEARVALDGQTNRADGLEAKMDVVCKDIKEAFTTFETEIKKRDDLISNQTESQKQVENANVVLMAERDVLKDKVSTLEYLEDERRLLQDQLTETEQTLENAKLEASQLTSDLAELRGQMSNVQNDLQMKNQEKDDLQEKLDSANAESRLVLLEKEEELAYSKKGMEKILQLMQRLRFRLLGLVKQNQGLQSDGNQGDRELYRLGGLEANQYQAEGIHETPLTTARTANSMIDGMKISGPEIQSNNVLSDNMEETGTQLFQAIVNACEIVRKQFREDIDNLEFKNAVLTKQLETMKEKLSSINQDDNELEQRLRDRIARLSKENSEKSEKLDDNCQTLKKLSNQIVELLQYKIQYQELLNKRQRKNQKRRSSSAGPLKFFA